MQRKQRFFGCDGNARSRIFPVYYKKGSFTRSRAICSNPSAEDRSDATRSNREPLFNPCGSMAGRSTRQSKKIEPRTAATVNSVAPQAHTAAIDSKGTERRLLFR